MPKTAETDQGLEGQAGVTVRPYASAQADIVGQYVYLNTMGEKLLDHAKRKLPAISLPPPKALCVAITAVSDRLHIDPPAYGKFQSWRSAKSR